MTKKHLNQEIKECLFILILHLKGKHEMYKWFENIAPIKTNIHTIIFLYKMVLIMFNQL